ncbi:hypothetical protein HU200_041322 [Digitaria exilis]|uniref:Reverse transcriptase/retrotransposon-derived protein RNase H-like domain-containing protein n=1 Tax=Digitaria exilis TaxID=1010633 RepID=A0A835B781_9POAL|nr:hypothetical protein HU200_041322 [Digitaria exilis]
MAGASELQELLAFDSSNHGQETGQGMAGDFPQLPLSKRSYARKPMRSMPPSTPTSPGSMAPHDVQKSMTAVTTVITGIMTRLTVLEKMKGVEPFQDMESSDATASKAAATPSRQLNHDLVDLVKSLADSVATLQASVDEPKKQAPHQILYHHQDRPLRFQKLEFTKFEGKTDPPISSNNESSKWMDSYWRRAHTIVASLHQASTYVLWASPAIKSSRRGSVVDFQNCPEAVLPRTVQLFTTGLQPPLSLDVEILNPRPTISRHRDEPCPQARAPQSVSGNDLQQGLMLMPPRAALPVPSTPLSAGRTTAVVEGCHVKHLFQAEMEERRRFSLCFNCNEKFGRGHNRLCQHIFLLDLANVDDTDDPGEPLEDSPQISRLAISVVRTSDTMQVHLQLGDTPLLALIDSGSAHIFIDEVALIPRGALKVTVANEQDFCALPLAGYDVVLGTQWLATLDPILWDFAALQMAFCHHNHQVCWQGVAGPPCPSPALCSHRDLHVSILDKFTTIFAKRSGMPPRRSRDHHINLLCGLMSVAILLYCYPASQKDERERQCAYMLVQGIIRHNTSAFPSPMLVVKKSDGFWRFYVDYHVLNTITVKDAYPISVVDELLDEPLCAEFFTKLDFHVAKTVFRTQDGLYECLAMPNIPSPDEHNPPPCSCVDSSSLERVIFGICAPSSTSCINAESIYYLSHTISATGVVADWPTTRSPRAVHGFLGLARYYKKFVKDIGFVATPLTALLRKEGFAWSEEEAAAFKALKTTITMASVLALPNFAQLSIVECDASSYGFGASNRQPHAIGLWRQVNGNPQASYSPCVIGGHIEYKAGSTNTDEATFHNVSGPRFDFVDRLRQAHSNPALVALAEEIKTKQHPAPWSLIDNVITFKRRLYIPLASTLLPEVITAIHDDCHKGIQRTLHHLHRDFILRSIVEYIRGLRS